jgi:uncharacterized HAD superfamily protein
MKIGFDVDDVLCKFIPPMLKAYKEKHWSSVDINDYIYQDTRIDWPKLKQLILDEKLYSLAPLVEEIKTQVNHLSKNNEIQLITSREKCHKDDTKQWLEENGIKYNELNFSDDKHLLCNDFWLESFTDDKLETILNISRYSPKTQPILKQQPWNWELEINHLIEQWKFENKKEINSLLERVIKI